MIATPLLAELNRVPSLHIHAFNFRRKGKEFPAWIFELLTTPTNKPVPLEQLRRFLSGGLRFLFHLLVLCTIFSIKHFCQFKQVAKSSLDVKRVTRGGFCKSPLAWEQENPPHIKSNRRPILPSGGRLGQVLEGSGFSPWETTSLRGYYDLCTIG